MERENTENKDRWKRDGRNVTLIGALTNVLLIILKFTAGIFGHSQALIADAVHSVSDLFTDAVVLFGFKMGRRAPDETHQFGHARIETLGSTIVGLALVLTALYLGIEAVSDLYYHIEYRPTNLALLGAGLSIILKEALFHSTLRVGQRTKSQLLTANAWHHRSDAFSSVAVLLGVLGTRINPSWHFLDTLAALLVSFFIIKVGLDILRRSLVEITDTAPRPEILDQIRACAKGVEGVIEIHDLRVRTSGGLYQMEAHVVVDQQLTVWDGHQIAKKVEACLVEDIEDMDRIIIHIDPYMEDKDAS